MPGPNDIPAVTFDIFDFLAVVGFTLFLLEYVAESLIKVSLL